MADLTELLQYKRPEGGETQKIFCDKYLKPWMGEPDQFGNYIHIVYNDDDSIPAVCFAAHSDTVHTSDGMQDLSVFSDTVMAKDSNCLGADCTTGVWLMLEMIAAGIPGVYVIHAGEEVGCVGSRALVKSNPFWLDHIQSVISFDRKGYKSVITHQLGSRTCSQEFALSLCDVLGMDYEPDDTGAYTDSNEYAGVVSECTNISVGYFSQHTRNEYQDLAFAEKLRDALIAADWSKLVFKRDPQDWDDEELYTFGWGRGYRKRSWTYDDSAYTEDFFSVEDLVRNYPQEIAEILEDYGFNAKDLSDEIRELNYKWLDKKVS